MGTKKCVEWGFGYGEFESELRSGCRARNGEFKGSRGLRTPTRAETLFGSVYPPNNTRGYQEMCGEGFRVRGIRIRS